MQNELPKIQWNDLNEIENYFFEKVGLMTDHLEPVEVARYDRTCGHKLLQDLKNYVGFQESFLRLTAGADGALALLFLFFKRMNLTLLIPQDSYTGFELIAQRLQCSYVKYNPQKCAEVLKRRDPNQFVWVGCSPNNPTGEVSTMLLKNMSEFKGYKVLDEAYFEFSPEQSLVANIQIDDKLFVVRTFSKAFAAAGVRLGYLVAQPSALQQLNNSQDPFAVSVLSVHYGQQILAKKDMMQKRVAVLKSLTQELIVSLRDLGYQCSSSHTHFFILRFEQFSELQRANALLRNEGFIFTRYEESLSIRIMVNNESSQKAILRILGKGIKC